MTDGNVDTAVIKKTQDVLGKYVKKPALTEKLLKKPPFRFLHDVIHAIIKDTGFLNGLYNKEELNSENIKDRDAKIDFLQKLIDVLKIVTGKNISARPSKIVAGHEPEYTNELLQIIGFSLDNKFDSKKAIETLKNGTGITKQKSITKTKPELSKDKKIQKTSNGKVKTEDKTSISSKPASKDKAKPKEKDQVKKVDSRTSNVEKSSKQIKGDTRKNEATKKHAPKVEKTQKLEKVTKIEKEPQGKLKSSGVSNEVKSVEKLEESNLVKNDEDVVIKRRKSSSSSISVKDEIASNIEYNDTNNNSNQNNNNNNSYSPNDDKSKKIKPSSITNPTIMNTTEEAKVTNITNEIESNKKPLEASNNNDSLSNSEISKAELIAVVDQEAEMRQKETAHINSSGSGRKSFSGKRQKSMNGEKSPASNERHSSSSKNSGKKSRLKSENSTDLRQIVEDDPPIIISEPVNNDKPVGEVIKRQSTFVREDSGAGLDPGSRPRTSLRPPSVRPVSARPGAPRRRDKNVEIILQPNEQVKMGSINVKIENFNAELEDDGENLIVIESSNTQDIDIGKSDDKTPQVDDISQQGHLVQQILETQKNLIQTDVDSGIETEWDTSTIQKRQSSAKQMDSLRDSIQSLTRSVNPLGKLMDFLPEDMDSMQLELNMWRDAYLHAANELKKEKSFTESSIEPMKNQLIQINANIKEYNEMIDASRAKILQNTEKIFKLLTDQ